MKLQTILPILILSLVLAGCDVHKVKGEVVESVYTPSSTGLVFGGKRPHIVTTPEQYTLIIRFDDGRVSSESVSAETYASVHKGQKLTAESHWYGITNIRPVDSF